MGVIRHYTYSLLFLLMTLFSYGQKNEPLLFDSAHWKQEVSELNFIEDKPETTSDSHVKNKKNFKFPNLQFLNGFVYIGVIILVAALLVLILNRFILINNTNTKLKGKYTAVSILDQELENKPIEEWNLNYLLEKYIKENNPRQVIRIYYLITLQQLHLIGKIQWEKNKTNEFYQQALLHTPLYPTFAKLSYIFNYVWYGEYPLLPEQYEEATQVFRTFIQSLRPTPTNE